MNSGKDTGRRSSNAREEQFIKLELKYCERCGELWIRRRGQVEARCRKCVAEEGRLTQLWRARSHPLALRNAKKASAADFAEGPANAAQRTVPPERSGHAVMARPRVDVSQAELSMGAIQL